ncbi:MAG: tyrosine-type recombinase/integrase [Microvirga sp.]|nr:tyrosine-type recombinase/integrase [Microvirga sp.]
MPRSGDYLFRRRGSQNWYVKLQYPGALSEFAATVYGRPVKRVEITTRTPDRAEAEIVAAPHIEAHKKLILLHKALSDPTRSYGRIIDRHLQPPGTTVNNPDGTRVVATTTQIVHLDPDGNLTKVEPNVMIKEVQLAATAFAPSEVRQVREAERAARKAVFKGVDSEIIENWIKIKRPARTHELAARKNLALFKEITNGRTLATAQRADAYKLVEALRAAGNKSATIKTKLSGIVAAINFEMKDSRNSRLKYNPFSAVAEKVADSTQRM